MHPFSVMTCFLSKFINNIDFHTLEIFCRETDVYNKTAFKIEPVFVRGVRQSQTNTKRMIRPKTNDVILASRNEELSSENKVAD